MADTGDKVIRVYSDFRGIDLRGEECALNRSPDALNVWRDYRELSGIKTRPALKHICSTGRSVRDMKWHNDRLYYYSAEGAYHYVELNPDGSHDHSGGDLQSFGNHGVLFEFNGSVYGLGSQDFIRIAGDGEDTYLVPTTSVGSLPDGTGRQTHQDVNMLTPLRINTFHIGEDVESRTAVDFTLDAQEVDKDYMPIITVNGERLFEGEATRTETENSVKWTFEPGLGIDPAYPEYSIQLYFKEGHVVVRGLEYEKSTKDNISILFQKTATDSVAEGDANLRKILGCTIVEEFDNRIFLSGNPDYPNLVFHSSLNNPMYFSDLDVYEDGKDDGHIRAMVSGNNALWVFRDTDKGNGVYYHTAAFDNTYGKIYPSAHSSVSLGCVGGAINFLDDILFFSRNGMESISQNITAEQFATHKSSLVDRLMLRNENYENMVFAEWEGYLLVCIGTDVYLADSRAVLANEGHYEYEWYHWNLGKYKINCAEVNDGKLYIGTDGFIEDDGASEGHIYCLDINGAKDVHADGEVAITSYWITPRDKFASSNKQKTTNKKGCIIEALGDFNIASRVDGEYNVKDEPNFDAGDTYTDVKDHVVTKIKRKKFKDIQLKFSSNTKFTLESATLEAFVGSFIKR